MLWTLIWLAIAVVGVFALAYVVSKFSTGKDSVRRKDLRRAESRASLYREALVKIANGDDDPRSVALTALVND